MNNLGKKALIAFALCFTFCFAFAANHSIKGSWLGTWYNQNNSYLVQFKANGTWTAHVYVNGKWVRPTGYDFNYSDPRYKVKDGQVYLYDGKNFVTKIGFSFVGGSVSFDDSPFKRGGAFTRIDDKQANSLLNSSYDEEGPGGQKM